MMRLRSIRSETTDPIARGTLHGTELSEDIRVAAAAYRRMFARLGCDDDWLASFADQTLAAVRSWRSQYAEEIEGIAHGSDVPLRDVVLLNARTEVLAHHTTSPECSTVVVTDPGRPPRGIQTWDWHAALAPTGMIHTMLGAHGRRTTTFAEPGTLAKIGVSTSGIGVHFNILHHRSDGQGAGVPVHVVARALLDEATSLEHAASIARTARVTASTVCTVLSRDESDAWSLELSPVGVGIVRPHPGGDARVLVHTNHFLDPDLAAGNVVDATSTTYGRAEFLQRRDADLSRAASLAELAAAMCGGSADAPVCMRPQRALDPIDQWETLLTIALDVEHAALVAVAGPPSSFASARRWTAERQDA